MFKSSDIPTRKIRGRSKFLNVFENLKAYASINPSRITVKYIFTEDNRGKNELQNFVKNCKLFQLQDCNFQISMNYKREKLELGMLKSVSFLYGKLINSGFKKIFLDDHVMGRFISLDNNDLSNLVIFLNENNIQNIFLDPKKIDNLIVYGAGYIGKEMVKKTNFFKFIKDFDVIDSDVNKIGGNFIKKIIKSPEILKDDKRQIYISAALNYDEIYKMIVSIRGNPNSILTGLIV
mgnify:CR=1 FL=1